MKGAGYLVAGFKLLPDRRLRLFVLAPLTINLLLFTGAIYWTGNRFEAWLDWLTLRLPDWLDWVEWLLWPLFAVAVVLILFYTFTMVANIIGAPFNGMLAERVEREIAGREQPGSGVSFWAEIPRAIAHEISKWAYIIPRALPLLILFLIPALNVLAPVAWFGFGAWMLAIEYVDYPMGNHGISFRRQRALLRERRLLALGFGLATMGMTLVPVLNFFAMPTAVIGATLMWAEQFSDRH